MMAKIRKGNSFGGCVKYVLIKKDTKLIAAKDVYYANHKTITESFNAQAELNPRLGKKVGHISLNFSAQDRDKVDDAFMRKAAREYMREMKIVDTPYIIVRHNDKDHPHCHIVFSRVDNNGKTISDKNDRLRSVKACREITEKHELYLKKIDAKQDVKREQLRGPDKIKYEIHDAIKAALPHCANWGELQKRLEKNGITLTYKFKGTTGEKEGVIFSKDNLSFNGSKVDRSFSYSKLDAALNENERKLTERATAEVSTANERQSDTTFRQTAEPQSPGHSRATGSGDHSGHSTIGDIGGMIGGLLDIQPGPPEEPDDSLLRELRKKKKPKKSRSRGI